MVGKMLTEKMPREEIYEEVMHQFLGLQPETAFEAVGL
jgi:hypothetical protein